jgi:curved DNA-binding protein CbpA
MSDPFYVLGVNEDADDEEVKRRYLVLVRTFSPERAPERFQEIRTAFESLRTPRGRLEQRVLRTGGGALRRLKQSCLAAATPGATGRVSRAVVSALLLEGATACTDPAGDGKAGGSSA